QTSLPNSGSSCSDGSIRANTRNKQGTISCGRRVFDPKKLSHVCLPYNSIKKNTFAGDENMSKRKLLRIDGRGIEDIFSQDDFKTFVLQDNEAKFKVENSQYVKDAQKIEDVARLPIFLAGERRQNPYR